MKAGRASVASLDEVRAVFETNVFGVIAVTQAMLPLLREAPAGRIVNVSSHVGSLTMEPDPSYPHRSIVRRRLLPVEDRAQRDHGRLRHELEATRIKVNAACPGYTATDLNNFQRHAQRRTGRARAGAPRAPRRGRPDGQLLERGRPAALVSNVASSPPKPSRAPTLR